MSEAGLEDGCRRHALKRGVLSVKLQSYIAGDPDRVFLVTRRRCWLVEFKSLTGRLSPRQQIRHAELALMGHPVTVVRTLEHFKAALDDQLRGV